MLRHYLLTAYRSFRLNRGTFLINLIGLTTGLSCTLLIFLWVNDELEMDKFHSEQVYQVMENQDYSGDLMTTRSTPGILAEALHEEIPEIEFATTLTWISPQILTVKGDKNFKADGWHVGDQYFNVFDFKLISGSPDEVLKDKMAIVLSEEFALKLFGSVDAAIGQIVEVQHSKGYVVSGVFENTPQSSSYQYDFVLNFKDYMDDNEWTKQWGNNGPGTVVRLKNAVDPQYVSIKIGDFIRNKHEESNVTLFLTSFNNLYLYGSYENGVQSGGRIEYVRLFSIIAVFILVIACINFMNLSTARAAKRSKEVGIRKTIGAGRPMLFVQYIGESTLVSFLSLVFSIVIVALFIPTFNEITSKEIVFVLSGEILLAAAIITVVTGLLAGSYPAYYLSNFRPVQVLKGDIRTTWGELWARRGLVVFQFTLSIILIISVVTVYNQIQYVQTKNLGYSRDNIVYFYQEGRVEDDLEVFMTEVKKIPGILEVSSIGHNLLGRQNNTSGLEWEGKDPETRILFENVRVNYGLIEMLGIEFSQGRSFSKDFGADSAKIIFNETAIKAMGLEDPIGKNVRLWEQYDMEIVGVVKDFHFQSLHRKVEPLFFRLRPNTTWVVMLKIEPNRTQETLASVEEFYKDFNPGFTFDPYFMDQEYAKQYAAEQRVATLSRYFAGFAVLISCLGLLGLAAFTAERRIKEIGIRKVLGATIVNIVLLLTKDFSRLVFFAILISMPIAYFLLSSWLNNFAYRIEISAWYFIGAGFAALMVAWLTVSIQALRAAHNDPTDSLRTE